MNYILKAYAIQDIGQRVSQEDSFFPAFLDPCHYDETSRDWSFYDGTPHTDDRLFILCDGMGGHDRGEIASRIVTQTMSKSLLEASSIEGTFSDEMIHNAVEEAFSVLRENDIPEEVKKMGTTMTVLKFHADGATIGHIGDSRVYHFRPATKDQPAHIVFRTQDHTVVNEMVRYGQMTLAQASHSPKKHVLSKAMTSSPTHKCTAEINHITDIKAGDIFMLCSDGIFENINDEGLCSLLTDPNDNDVQRIQHILHECIDNKDNHTAIIIRVVDIINTTDKMKADASLTPGTILQSKNFTYHIENVLGHGAFGITYLVNTSVSMRGQLGTIHTGVKVALKEFCMEKEMRREGSDLVAINPDSKVQIYADKFRQEASKLSMLTHPNIVRVLEVFEANNTIYYAMEYLAGGNLNEYATKKGGIPEIEAIEYIRQIGSALMYMHTNKMLHLDVKPANVMLIEDTNTVKIIDFGLAKRFEENGDPKSGANLGFGTPGYAPLEQVDGSIEHEFAPELDVYAIGATYYKLLTGQTPGMAVDVLNHGLNTLPLVKKNVSQQSIDAIKAAMEPIKTKRIKSIEAFLNMLPRVDDQSVFPDKQKNNIWKKIAIALIFVIIGMLGAYYAFHEDEANADVANSSSLQNDFEIEMIKVEGGTFTMGCTTKEYADADPDEQPLRRVKVSTFHIGAYEVTQAQWHKIMDKGKVSKSKNDDFPIFNVSWDEIQVFIERLNELTGRHFRLPTEAEWEYAARGGKIGISHRKMFSGDMNADKVAWHDLNSNHTLHKVGQLQPNELGIYDMSGNVWEYCSDWYGEYKGNNLTNPKGPKDGDFHVVRGGSCFSSSHHCRVTYRQDNSLISPSPDFGFRLAEDWE